MKQRMSKKARAQALRILGIGVGLAIVTFVIGYVLAVRVLFPPLPEPADGIAVPSVVGLTVPNAEAALNRVGLRVTEVIELAHPTQPPGIISAQNPLPGQQLRTAGAVQLAVSSGLPRVAVPNVVGLTVERALAVLGNVGLQADQRSEFSESPAGTVIRVAPAIGIEQPSPGRVLIVISSGPAPALPDTVPVDTTSSGPPAGPPVISLSGTTT